MACGGCTGSNQVGAGSLVSVGARVMYVVVSRDNIAEVRVFDDDGIAKRFSTAAEANAVAPSGCLAKGIMI